ncbi:alpha/beta fold hydrolase [Streptosporangium sp. NPDC087985]|uniref:alpha/beta fold hydrolase n=1 Tax=Streptosporangium sp. NPDC087985 TaxID=3366196 RepID=UPI00381D7386
MIRLGDTEFGYDEAGSGPAVVLLHAGCADRRMWAHPFRVLSGRYRVIRYDWRGYGESGDATGEFAHHEDLLALLDALGVDQAVLVGSSDGGKIALDATLTAPERITALTLVAPGLSGHVWPPSMAARYRERVHDVIGIDRLRSYRAGEVETIDVAELEAYAAAETEFLVAGPGRTRDDLDPQVWELALTMDRLLNERSWTGPHGSARGLVPPAKGRLTEVEVPILVVTGLADVPEILEVSDLLAREIRKARRVDLPETGHLPPLERPEEFTAALTDFLATL